MNLTGTLRTVALIEAAKGALVLLVGGGLLSLAHHDIQHFAERLIAHGHLNPASRYPHVFIDLAQRLTDTRMQWLAAGAALYAVVRFIEAYGLWHARRWAEWFAALSAGIYVPFELFEFFERRDWLSAGVLTLNVLIVSIMLYCAIRTRQEACAHGIQSIR